MNETFSAPNFTAQFWVCSFGPRKPLPKTVSGFAAAVCPIAAAGDKNAPAYDEVAFHRRYASTGILTKGRQENYNSIQFRRSFHVLPFVLAVLG
jgi:hypothetical protein